MLDNIYIDDNGLLMGHSHGTYKPGQMPKVYSGGTIWHYTNIQAFNSILESNLVLASDFRDLNDQHEFSYGSKVFHRILDEYYSENLINSTEYNNIRKIINDTLTSNSLENKLYAVSFSKASDSNFQWAMYGNSGLGVSFGIDSSKNFRPLNPVRYSRGYEAKSLAWVVVIYKLKQQELAVRSLLNDYIEKEKIWKLGLDFDFTLRILSLISSLKDPDFSSEREVRGILLSKNIWPHQEINGKKYYHWSGVDYHNNRAINSKIPITHVTFGKKTPLSDRHLIVEKLKSLSYDDINIDVSSL